MAEQRKDEKSGKPTDEKKPPEKGKKKDEPKADSGAPKPAQSYGVYKLVALKPVEGPQDWIIKIDVYYSAPQREYLGVKAVVEVLDGGVREVTVEKFGLNLHLSYQRHDRTVQFSVVRLWWEDDNKAINPDVHTDPVFLPGKPFARMKPWAEPRPEQGVWANLKAAFRGRW